MKFIQSFSLKSFSILRISAALTLASFIFTSTAGAAPAGAPAGAPFIPSLPTPAILFGIPEELGSIEEVYEGKGDNLVVYIQDAHTNYSAQKSIASVVEKLLVEHNISLVGEEGAEGAIDPTILRAFPVKEAVQYVMDQSLRDGEINGTEYLAITGNQKFNLVGVDKHKLYLKNLSQFLAVLENQESGMRFVRSTRMAMKNLQNTVYSEAHRELSVLLNLHERGELDVVTFISKLSKIAESLHENINQYQQLSHVVEFIQKQGGGHAEDREQIKSALKAVDAERLFLDIENLTYVLKNRLAASALEQKLVKLEEYLLLFERGLDLELSRKDARRLKVLHKTFSHELIRQFLTESSRNCNIKLLLNASFAVPSDAYYQKIMDFYRTAIERDEVLTSQLRDAMRVQGKNSAILVAGGFHREGITKELRRTGISYAVVLPHVSEMSSHEEYLRIMKEQRNLLNLPERNTIAAASHLGFRQLYPAFVTEKLSAMVRYALANQLTIGGVDEPSLLFRADGITPLPQAGLIGTDHDFVLTADRWNRRYPNSRTYPAGELRSGLASAARGTLARLPAERLKVATAPLMQSDAGFGVAAATSDVPEIDSADDSAIRDVHADKLGKFLAAHLPERINAAAASQAIIADVFDTAAVNTPADAQLKFEIGQASTSGVRVSGSHMLRGSAMNLRVINEANSALLAEYRLKGTEFVRGDEIGDTQKAGEQNLGPKLIYAQPQGRSQREFGIIVERFLPGKTLRTIGSQLNETEMFTLARKLAEKIYKMVDLENPARVTHKPGLDESHLLVVGRGVDIEPLFFDWAHTLNVTEQNRQEVIQSFIRVYGGQIRAFLPKLPDLSARADASKQVSPKVYAEFRAKLLSIAGQRSAAEQALFQSAFDAQEKEWTQNPDHMHRRLNAQFTAFLALANQHKPVGFGQSAKKFIRRVWLTGEQVDSISELIAFHGIFFSGVIYLVASFLIASFSSPITFASVLLHTADLIIDIFLTWAGAFGIKGSFAIVRDTHVSLHEMGHFFEALKQGTLPESDLKRAEAEWNQVKDKRLKRWAYYLRLIWLIPQNRFDFVRRTKEGGYYVPLDLVAENSPEQLAGPLMDGKLLRWAGIIGLSLFATGIAVTTSGSGLLFWVGRVIVAGSQYGIAWAAIGFFSRRRSDGRIYLKYKRGEFDQVLEQKESPADVIERQKRYAENRPFVAKTIKQPMYTVWDPKGEYAIDGVLRQRNLVHGGKHAPEGNLSGQEFMPTVLANDPYVERIATRKIWDKIRELIKFNPNIRFVERGREGGAVATYKGYEREALEMITKAIQLAGYEDGGKNKTVPDTLEELNQLEAFRKLGSDNQDRIFVEQIYGKGNGTYRFYKVSNRERYRLLQLLDSWGWKVGVWISLDFASSEMQSAYRDRTGEEENTDKYDWYNRENVTAITGQELDEEFKGYARDFPIVTLEDAKGERDWKGYVASTQWLKAMHIASIADDIGTTNHRTTRQILTPDSSGQQVATDMLIKSNQIGTMTETFLAMETSIELDASNVSSHRSQSGIDALETEVAAGFNMRHRDDAARPFVHVMAIKVGGNQTAERTHKHESYDRITEAHAAGVVYTPDSEMKLQFLQETNAGTNIGTDTNQVIAIIRNMEVTSTVPVGTSYGEGEAHMIFDNPDKKTGTDYVAQNFQDYIRPELMKLNLSEVRSLQDIDRLILSIERNRAQEELKRLSNIMNEIKADTESIVLNSATFFTVWRIYKNRFLSEGKKLPDFEKMLKSGKLKKIARFGNEVGVKVDDELRSFLAAYGDFTKTLLKTEAEGGITKDEWIQIMQTKAFLGMNATLPASVIMMRIIAAAKGMSVPRLIYETRREGFDEDYIFGFDDAPAEERVLRNVHRKAAFGVAQTVDQSIEQKAYPAHTRFERAMDELVSSNSAYTSESAGSIPPELSETGAKRMVRIAGEALGNTVENEIISAVEGVVESAAQRSQKQTDTFRIRVFRSIEDFAEFKASIAQLSPKAQAKMVGVVDTVMLLKEVAEANRKDVELEIAELFLNAKQIYVRDVEKHLRTLNGSQSALLGELLDEETERFLQFVDRRTLDAMRENGNAVKEAIYLRILADRVTSIAA